MPDLQTGLFFDDIDKHFGGNYALKDVSLTVGRGEIVALLGENGAGKSTLIKVLGGIHTPDAGRVLIDGESYHHRPAGFGERQKVAFIHQDLGLIEWMTVADNIALALGFARKNGTIRWNEVERLFAAIRPLRDCGVGMIYVSHRLDEIFRIADRVAVLQCCGFAVLRDGAMVGVRSIDHTTPEELVQKIVGRKTRETVKASEATRAEILKLDEFRVSGVGPLNFSLKRNEIVGLVGLRGAGHEAISRALFGLVPFEGRVQLDAETLQLANSQQALAAGNGLVAKDRTEESVAMSLTIRENTFLNPQCIGRTLLNLLSPRTEADQAAVIGAELGLSPNDLSLAIEALSGGNQQKVVIGRWLATKRKLLVCEDPTAGVDVGAKSEIYALLNKALSEGVGILIISTDFEEIATICHRAIVFSQGTIVDELSGTRLTTENLIQSASAGNVATRKEPADAIA